MRAFHVEDHNVRTMWTLAEELVPIYRTLVSPGFEESLGLVQNRLPLNIKRYPSGGKVFDWTIPQSWTVREAYLADTQGRRIIEYANEPLFVGPYSQPFSGVVEKQDLMPHLNSLSHLPDAIPLCPSYYAKDWKLGIPDALKKRLNEDRYRVHIDSRLEDGNLCIGEAYLPGRSEKEIILTTYMCHPVMANDNISGVAVASELFRILSSFPERNFSYRLIIIPETIGSITFLYHHQPELKNVIGGYNLTCCGDPGKIHFKQSWSGDSLLDRAARKVLMDREQDHRILPYYLSGSDERQFNAPGFRIPMPTIMRTPPAQFPEYHSSFDNLKFITPDALRDTLQFVLDTLFVVDNNRTYKNIYRAEPFLSDKGIFTQVHVGPYGVFNKGKAGVDPGYLNQIVIHETDGRQDLLSIAEKWSCPFPELLHASEKFKRVDLVNLVE